MRWRVLRRGSQTWLYSSVLVGYEPFVSPRRPSSSVPPSVEIMPRVSASSVAPQKRALRVLRAEFSKRKGDLRDLVKSKQAVMEEIRGKIVKLEKEVKAANEELSEEFDSGSSLFPSSESESESADSALPGAAKRVRVPISKQKGADNAPTPSFIGKPEHLKQGVDGDAVEETRKQADGKPRTVGARKARPYLPPGADAPEHRGSPNSEGVLYPGFAEGDPKRCDACEQLRRGFPRATKAHRPKEMPCPWAPLAKHS